MAVTKICAKEDPNKHCIYNHLDTHIYYNIFEVFSVI